MTALDTAWLADGAGVAVPGAWEAVTAALEGRHAGPVAVGDELLAVRHRHPRRRGAADAHPAPWRVRRLTR